MKRSSKIARARTRQIEKFCNETVAFSVVLLDAIDATEDANVTSGCLWELFELRALMQEVHQHIEKSQMDLRRL